MSLIATKKIRELRDNSVMKNDKQLSILKMKAGMTVMVFFRKKLINFRRRFFRKMLFLQRNGMMTSLINNNSNEY